MNQSQSMRLFTPFGAFTSAFIRRLPALFGLEKFNWPKDYARNRFFPGKGPATAAGKH